MSAELFKKDEVVPDGSGHRGVFSVRNIEFCRGLADDARNPRVVGVASEGAEVMRDVMVQAASEKPDDRAPGGVVGCGGKNVINPVVEFSSR